MRAPTASRLHFTPRHWTRSQFFLSPKFFSRLGRLPRLLMTTSSEPSLSRSPAAEPLDDHAAMIPEPAASDRSLNLPPPIFQNSSRGWRNFAPVPVRSTSG